MRFAHREPEGARPNAAALAAGGTALAIATESNGPQPDKFKAGASFIGKQSGGGLLCQGP